MCSNHKYQYTIIGCFCLFAWIIVLIIGSLLFADNIVGSTGAGIALIVIGSCCCCLWSCFEILAYDHEVIHDGGLKEEKRVRVTISEKTPITINSPFLRAFDRNKLISAYFRTIGKMLQQEIPNDISKLCQSYYSDTFNIRVGDEYRVVMNDGIVYENTSNIYNVRGYNYIYSSKSNGRATSSACEYVWLYSQSHMVDNPLPDKLRSIAIYLESYCHELDTQFKSYRERKLLGTQQMQNIDFVDEIIVGEIPGLNTYRFEGYTFTIYMDIFYMTYNHIERKKSNSFTRSFSNSSSDSGEKEKEDEKEDEKKNLVKQLIPDDIYRDIKLSSNINYEWKIDEELLNQIKNCIQTGKYYSHNFGLNGADIADQYGFSLWYKPKKEIGFIEEYWIGTIGLSVLAKPRNVGKLVCDIKIETDLEGKREKEDEVRKYECEIEEEFEWDENGRFANFRVHAQIDDVPFHLLDTRNSMIITASIKIKEVYNCKNELIDDESDWLTVGILSN